MALIYVILGATILWIAFLGAVFIAGYFWEEITGWFKKIGRSKC